MHTNGTPISTGTDIANHASSSAAVTDTQPDLADRLDIPRTEQDELVALLRPMRADIVKVESPETGTPLPDSYEAAPPLK
jgi:hypothetical protein